MTLAAAPILNYGPTAYLSGNGSRRDELTGDNAQIADEILSPILDSRDIKAVFAEKLPAFRQWRNGVADALAPGVPQDLDAVLRQEDIAEEALRGIFDGAWDRLGRAVKPLLEGIRLRKIVRKSMLPHLESWPEKSWAEISRLMTASELCQICVLHHLATGEGRKGNVSALAIWCFEYALEAYFDAGYASGELGLWRKLERDE